MEHKLTPMNSVYNSISVVELNEKEVVIKIDDDATYQKIHLSKKELHSFIGTLLHVQQKMK